jgi:hypothetical protein
LPEIQCWAPAGVLCALYGLGCRHDNSAANERRIWYSRQKAMKQATVHIELTWR